jgi:hypothetical protein
MVLLCSKLDDAQYKKRRSGNFWDAFLGSGEQQTFQVSKTWKVFATDH